MYGFLKRKDYVDAKAPTWDFFDHITWKSRRRSAFSFLHKQKTFTKHLHTLKSILTKKDTNKRHIIIFDFMFLFSLYFEALYHLIRISKIFAFLPWLWALSSDIGARLVWCTLLFGNLKGRRHLRCKKCICFLQCYVCATWLCEAGACPKQQCYSGWVAPIVITRAQSAKKHKNQKF